MDQETSRTGKTGGIYQTAKVALAALLIGLAGFFSSQAWATFIDTDTYCINYGCVVVGDGTDFDVYDAFNFATNTCCVAANQIGRAHV